MTACLSASAVDAAIDPSIGIVENLGDTTTSAAQIFTFEVGSLGGPWNFQTPGGVQQITNQMQGTSLNPQVFLSYRDPSVTNAMMEQITYFNEDDPDILGVDRSRPVLRRNATSSGGDDTRISNRVVGGDMITYEGPQTVIMDFRLGSAGAPDGGAAGERAYLDQIAFDLTVAPGVSVDLKYLQTSDSSSFTVFEETVGPGGSQADPRFVGFDRLDAPPGTGNFDRLEITFSGAPTNVVENYIIDDMQFGSISATAVPEPSSFAFALIAGSGFVARRIRKKKATT